MSFATFIPMIAVIRPWRLHSELIGLHSPAHFELCVKVAENRPVADNCGESLVFDMKNLFT